MRRTSLVGIGLALTLVAGMQARQSQQPPQQQPPATPPTAAPPPTASSQPPSQPQQQDPQPVPPRIRSGINYVRVDAIVTDKQGNPVIDLTKDEFRIKEDGKPQTIDSFSLVKIDPVAQQFDAPVREIRSLFDEQREAQRPDVRLFIILLDDYHVRRGNDMAVRKPLIEFIENQLAPADMVAIMYPLTPVTGLTFTRNRKALVSAIENFQGRRFDYQPRNEYEEKYAYYPAQTVEMIRNQVVMTALKGAAIRLGGLREGRKSIIFVSEGFTTILPPQLNDPVAANPGVRNPARGTQVQNTDRMEWNATVDMVSDLSLIFTEMNRNNTSVYAVDPKGLAAFEYDINQGVGLQTDRKYLEMGLDTLRALADNTDGRAIINRNDIGKGMQQIIRDASAYYLIGYNSAQAPTDGRFHKIDVDVTRKGVDVRARKGYWAYTAEDAARIDAPRVEAPPAVTAALSTLVDPPRGRPARFWIGTARGESGKSKVTFAWEPVPPVPGERRAGDEGVAYVTLTALAPDGRPLFRGRVPDQGRVDADGGDPCIRDRRPGQRDIRGSTRADAVARDGPERRGSSPGFVDERRQCSRLHRPAGHARHATAVSCQDAAGRPGRQGQPIGDTVAGPDVCPHRAAARSRGCVRARERAAGSDGEAVEPFRHINVRCARSRFGSWSGGARAPVLLAGGGGVPAGAQCEGRGKQRAGDGGVQGQITNSSQLQPQLPAKSIGS